MSITELITQQIIEKLEKGIIPWKKPYKGKVIFPMNFKSNSRYNGINCLNLMAQGYTSPYWLTYNQAMEELGYKLKKEKGRMVWKWNLDGEDPKNGIIKGEKGCRILFAKTFTKENKEGKEEDVTIWKYSTVFNIAQIKGLECPFDDEIIEEDIDYINNCEEALSQMNESKRIPEIKYHEKQIAFYRPSTDEIFTCPPERYVGAEEYYGTIFHEIIHSTGHMSRLNRDLKGGKKSQSYAKEELIAEIGACFLCGITGISTSTIDNSVAYINSWLSHLRKDPQLIISASSSAQKAFDYLNVEIEVELNTI